VLLLKIGYPAAVRRLFLLACVSLCAGCFIAPVRIPTHIQTASHVDVPYKADLAFIRPGITQRDEIVQRLKWMAVGMEGDRVFWGAWRSSSWAIAGGGISVAGSGVGAERLWGGHTLLVEFDDQGIVKRHVNIEDKHLARELFWAARDRVAALDLSAPIEIAGEYERGRKITVTLSSQALALREAESGAQNRQVFTNRLRRYSIRANWDRATMDAEVPELQVGFLPPRNSSSLEFFIIRLRDIHDILMLFRYLVETGAQFES
jgi:hypothetical protein